MHSLPLCLCLAMSFAWVLLYGTPAPLRADMPTPETIAAAGRHTQERLATDAASWTTVIELPNDFFAEVDTVRTATMQTHIIRLGRAENQLEVARIVDRDGFWYVSTRDEDMKTRPYEAPLPFPASYIFLAASDVRMIVHASERLEKPITVDGNVATYHLPLEEAQANSLRNSLKAMQEMKPHAKGANKAKLEELLRQAEAALANGAEIKVAVDTGVILEASASGKRQWTKHFQWLPNEIDAPFNVADRNWNDRTEAIADPDSLQDLILISNQPLWKSNAPAGDMNPLLFNIRTQQMRRVPYQNGDAMAGGFSQDRSRVYVTGHLPDEGALGLFEIDLATGDNKPLGAPLLQTGQTLGASLSPDGRKLAAVKKVETRGKALDFQIVILDLQSDETRLLGEPADLAFPTWLPDGNGLILVTREHETLDQASINTICRMDMNGKVTPLRKGSHPIVLTKLARILYEDDDSDLWYTCDLQGQDARLVGDGLKGYGFPTVSPNEKQMIMMKFGGENGPRPHVVELDSGKSSPLPVGPGLWAYPIWR